MATSPRADLNAASDEAPIDGRRMAAALRAAAVPIAVTVVAITLLTLLGSSLATDRFRATARIVDTSSSADTTTSGADRSLTTAQALVTTPAVLGAAARRLPGESAASLSGKVSAGVQSDAGVLDVRATDTSAAGAAAIANAVARAYLDRQAATQLAAINRTRANLQAQLARLTAPTDAAQAAALQARLNELAVEAANAGTDLQLAEPARPPGSPYAPRPLRNAVVAFLAALLAAVFVVLVRERLRPRIGSARELGRLAGVPVLASLPPAHGARGLRAADGLETLARRVGPLEGVAGRLRRRRATRDERDVLAVEDAVRSLLGTVLLELTPDRRHLLAVTSPQRDDASARVTAELGRALARAGQPTLVLSSDLGSSALARALGVPPVPGLGDRIGGAEGRSLTIGVLPVPDQERLDVLPAGRPPRDGVGLLRPGLLDELMAALGRAPYRYVVVDAPALEAPETRLVLRRADAVLLACPERSAAEELAEARATLERSGVTPLGAVTTAGPSSSPGAARSAPGRRPVLASAAGPDAVAALERDTAAGNGTGPVAGDAPAATTAHEDVLACLRAADGPLSVPELQAALGDPASARVRSSLARLVEQGDVVRVGGGTRRDPYRYGPPDA